MNYYIETIQEFQDKIKERKENAKEIKTRLNEWILGGWGIKSFSEITKKYFDWLPAEKTTVILARQLTSIAIEDIAFYIVGFLLGLFPATMHLLIDCFSTRNHDKVSRLKMPWIHYAKSGAQCLEYKTITEKDLRIFDGLALGGIKTKGGQLISEFHADLRRRVFPEHHFCRDVSGIHLQYMKLAKVKPLAKTRPVNWPTVYPGLVRPTAEWYYPLYLSWFLTGEMVLFENFDCPEEVEINIVFEKTMEKIFANTGRYPLIVRIPSSTNMSFYNEHILNNPHALKEIMEKSKEIIKKSGAVQDIFQEVVDIAIAYH